MTTSTTRWVVEARGRSVARPVCAITEDKAQDALCRVAPTLAGTGDEGFDRSVGEVS
jgi:hypothetical protein